MSIVDTTIQNHHYQLVLVYASKNCPFSELVLELQELLEPNFPTVITGDFNFDKETNALTKFLGKVVLIQEFYPNLNLSKTSMS